MKTILVYLPVLISVIMTQNLLNAQNINYKIENIIEFPDKVNMHYLGKNADNKLFMITCENPNASKFQSLNIKFFSANKIDKTISIGGEGEKLIASPNRKYFALSKSRKDESFYRISTHTIFKTSGEVIFEKEYPQGEYHNWIYLGNKYNVIKTYEAVHIFDNSGFFIKNIDFRKLIKNYDMESITDVCITDEVIYFAIKYYIQSDKDNSILNKSMLYEYNIIEGTERTIKIFDNNPRISQLEFDPSNTSLYLMIQEPDLATGNSIYKFTKEDQLKKVYGPDKIGKIKSLGNYIVMQKYKNLVVLDNKMEIIINSKIPRHAYNISIKDDLLYYLTFNNSKAKRGQDRYRQNVNLTVQNLNTKAKQVIPLINKIKSSVLLPTDIILDNGKVYVSFHNKLFYIVGLNSNLEMKCNMK